ncbi:MAG: alpha/beta hydrolase [Rhodobacteraceae bacterium]|nr:alpha/beta hydrolase [Paracoccaceae bacterium]
MRSAAITLMLLTMFSLSALSATAQPSVSDLSYGPRDRNTLDLYLPESAVTPPIVVFIHGGRWFRNDKTQIELYDRIPSLLNAGIAIASINYTYSSEAIWPAQLEDVLAALRFVRDNAETYGYDADRIAVWGQSSGAHLALWAGLTAADAAHTTLSAVVSWYAPSDLTAIAGDRLADAVPGGNEKFPEPTPESLLIGAPAPDNKDLADAASPAAHLQSLRKGAPLPKFLLMHGTDDFVVSPLQTERMHRMLKAQGGAETLEMEMIPGGKHGGEVFTSVTPRVVEFLRESFGQP